MHFTSCVGRVTDMPDMSVDGYKFCKIFSYLVPDGNHSSGELLPHIVSSI